MSNINLTGISGTTTTSSYPIYDSSITWRDPYMEQKRVFYTEILEFLDVPKEESESLQKMVSSTDTETIIIFKELFKVIFDRQLKKKFKTI